MTLSTRPWVQLHYASIALVNDQALSAQFLRWLSPQEHTRYQRFVNAQQAKQFLLARALLRCQLSKQVPHIQPHEWVFVMDDYGKPRLADEFAYLNIHFNLSHSEEVVVVALSDGLELGVDVECLHRPVFSMALAKRYFAKTEWADLNTLAKKQQKKRIAQLWTLKESYLKASGLGIRVPLDKLAFCFEGESSLALRASPCLQSSLLVENNHFIGLYELGADYSLALTIISDFSVDVPVVKMTEFSDVCEPLSPLSCALLRKAVA